MTKDEALRLALEAFEEIADWYVHDRSVGALADSMYEASCLAKVQAAAIKAALEAKDEPVAFFDWYDNAHWGNEDFKEGCHRAWNAAIKYTAKPNQEAKDEPVGDNKVKQLVNQCTHRDIDGNWYVDGVQLVHATCDAIIKGTI